ncbi:MAG TPA: hypothetical protein VF741_01150, partial [Candidatus Aquilonibacter sp.]
EATFVSALVGALAAFHVFCGKGNFGVKAAAAGFFAFQSAMVAFARFLSVPIAAALGALALLLLAFFTRDRLREGISVILGRFTR